MAVWRTGYGQTNPPSQSGGLNVPFAEPLGTGISALILSVGPAGGMLANRDAAIPTNQFRSLLEGCTCLSFTLAAVSRFSALQIGHRIKDEPLLMNYSRTATALRISTR